MTVLVAQCSNCESENVMIMQANVRKACIDNEVKRQMYRTVWCNDCSTQTEQTIWNKSCCGNRAC